MINSKKLLKNALLVSLFSFHIFSVLGCNSKSNSAQPSPYNGKYGRTIFPGVVPPLADSYRPAELSAKVFEANGKTQAPFDFSFQNLTLQFDASQKFATGHSRIFFFATADGHPYFQLKATPRNATLNGELVTVSEISDPDGQGNKFWSVDHSMQKGSSAFLEFEYDFPLSQVSFENNGVGFLTDMSDLVPVNYFETWGPAGFEDDSFSLVLNLDIKNSSTQHRVYTNGMTAQKDPFHWTISFPDYFTTSSFYAHLTNRELKEAHFSVQGSTRSIPVTLYSANSELLAKAEALLPGLFQEMEADYGPYAHSGFTAYLLDGGGGMEYVGATITSLWALDHELFHSWFARGVMPAEGRSGWIDEGMASWRDNGYFQATSLLQRTPTNLSAFSPFRISTPSNCYRDGRGLFSELDLLLQNFGGLKPVMREFFMRYRYKVVTNEELQNFLELRTQMDLDLYFQRYTLGQNVPATTLTEEPENNDPGINKHPPRLTETEVRKIR